MESVYKVIEIIGTSEKGWAEAAKVAMERASQSLRDLRVGEVVEQDVRYDEGTLYYRTKLRVSFKYQD